LFGRNNFPGGQLCTGERLIVGESVKKGEFINDQARASQSKFPPAFGQKLQTPACFFSFAIIYEVMWL
jgi:hypothetical protein